MAPFITTTELTNKIGRDAVNAKGTLAIETACDTIRFITGQTITAGTTTAYLDGTGTDALPLPQRPVLSAGTVIESGGTLTLGTDYKLGANGILYRLPGTIDNGWGDPVTRTHWWPGRQNVVVTYVHGYSTVDSAVKGVALDLAGRIFTQDPGVVFESIGQRSVRWDRAASELTGTEKIVLEGIKR